jgi:hypothetical protein
VHTKELYALNCDRVRAFAPGASVRYEMRLQTDAEAPTGEVTIDWQLIGWEGPHARAALQMQGNDHPCRADCASPPAA